MDKANKIQSFTDLNVWKEGHQLVIAIYQATKLFPKSETYSLIDQMRRAAASVTSNIAEGFGRQSFKEKLQFYFLPQGSLLELKNLILIAKDVGYFDQKEFNDLAEQANTVDKLLRGFLQKTRTLVDNK